MNALAIAESRLLAPDRPRHRRIATRVQHTAWSGHRLRRPVFPAFAPRELEHGGRHRQGRRAHDRAGRRRARDLRREDRLRLLGRLDAPALLASAQLGAGDRARRPPAWRRSRWRAAADAAVSRRSIRSTPSPTRPRSRCCGASMALVRALDPRVQQVMVSLSGARGHRAGRAQRRRAGRRRAPAGADERAGDRRAERPPRIRVRRVRRALLVRAD